MLGGGVIAAMQKAYSENRALGKRKRGKNDAGIDHLTREQRKAPLKFNELSERELEEFRLKLQQKKKVETRKRIVVFLISVFLVFGLFAYLFN